MKWSIGKKLGAGFGFAIVAFTLLGFIAYRGTKKLDDANNFETATYKTVIEANDVSLALLEAEAGLSGYLLTGRKENLDTHNRAAASIEKELQDLQSVSAENYQPRLKDAGGALKKRLAEYAEALKLYGDKDKGSEAAKTVFDSTASSQSVASMLKLFSEISEHERAQAKVREKEGDDLALETQWTILILTVVIFVVLIAFSILLTNNITTGAQRLLGAANKIAACDLRQNDIPVTTTDELGDLTVAFNAMLGSIKEMTGQTRTATQNINTATAEILASTQEQAAGTAEQAAAVQQTTTTVEEINQSGNQVSERAKQVAATAEAASATSHAGIQAVENTNKTMEAIREQAEAVAENIVTLSEKTQTVGEIISTVNDIAEQSNLLALNAAIEAAAAGEHGRRFSVVATELKNLADQSKGATVQVRTILGDIQKGINTSVMLTEETVKRVDLGKQQADVAERTIRQMAESTVGSVQAFQQIVAATNQQQIGFEQVTQALKNIRVASQQTAAGTQQMEKAAANLNALGQQLNKSVERYQL